jgi:hypothetical protein
LESIPGPHKHLKIRALGTSILYRAGEERFCLLAAQSTYIA